MKQGRASVHSSGSQKTEPRSMAINPGGVAQIGEALGNHVTDSTKRLDPVEAMHQGRGYKAPSIPSTTHRGGSQGRR